MTTIAISSLPVASSAAITDLIPIVQSGITKQLTNANLFTSPTLVTPALGTPASGNLANCLGLPIAGGGTGATTAAGARSNLGISAVATGMVMMWPTTSAPSGFVLCNGASLDTTTYANLFAVIGYTFGGSSANFNVPNYTNRFPIGAGTHALAATGGSADAVVVSHNHAAASTSTSTSTVTESPHHHSLGNVFGVSSVNQVTATSGIQYGAGNTGDATTGLTVATATSTSTTNTAAGVSGTNANLPPYLAINFIIAI